VAPDRVGEDPEVVPQAFCNDVEVPAGFFKLPVKLPVSFFELLAIPLVRPGEGPSQLPQLGFDRSETTINGLKTAIDRLKTAIDRSETAVHGSFELGDSHRRAATRAHHSIVARARTMPSAEGTKRSVKI
jgi:hypothetical protein